MSMVSFDVGTSSSRHPYAPFDLRPTSSVVRAAPETRRSASRRAVVLPCQAVRERDFVLVADRTLDISTEGLLLPLRSSVLTGESLIVSFAIPGLWIDAEATVVRVVHGRRPGDDGRAIGVVFDRLSSSTRAALAAFLHARRAPLPRRGPLARLRRGEPPPQLADAAVMDRAILPSLVGASDPLLADVVEIADEDVVEVTDEDGESPELDEVDGLGVLRAVVGAWQRLALDDPRA